ncbi:hypothetical protein C3L33_05432, partial [Rhododendron williamsianum]
MRYTVKKDYSIYGWELGNELSGSGVGVRVAADQYASDAISLQNVVLDIYKSNETRPLTIGPGGFFDENWFKEFADKTTNSVDVLTHHIYNLGPGVDEHLVEKIVDPSYLDGEADTFSKLQSTLKSSTTSATAWVDASPPPLPIPTIDISLLSLPSSGEEVEQLRSALSSWGCFQAIGHGIPDSYLDKVREVAKQFFSLPMEEKKKYSRGEKDGEGYGGDLVVSEKQVLDWSDRLTLKVLPEDERRPIFGQNSQLSSGHSKVIEFGRGCLSEPIWRSTRLTGRFNFYPPCPRPDQVLGLKPHSDRSGMTVLLQDREVEGLHVLKDNQWFRVPIIPMLLLSMSAIKCSRAGEEIGPAEGLIDEERPRLYRNVKNYGAINFQCFQRGEVAIDTVKI